MKMRAESTIPTLHSNNNILLKKDMRTPAAAFKKLSVTLEKL